MSGTCEVAKTCFTNFSMRDRDGHLRHSGLSMSNPDIAIYGSSLFAAAAALPEAAAVPEVVPIVPAAVCAVVPETDAILEYPSPMR